MRVCYVSNAVEIRTACSGEMESCVARNHIVSILRLRRHGGQQVVTAGISIKASRSMTAFWEISM